MHDSQAAIPLALMTAERVTNCYDLMDAAYCSSVLREHSRSLGHVPLIDHNPRTGEKIELQKILPEGEILPAEIIVFSYFARSSFVKKFNRLQLHGFFLLFSLYTWLHLHDVWFQS